MPDEQEKVRLEKRWRKLQELLEYTDEELKTYRSQPKKVKAVEAELARNNIVVEIIAAHNCVMGYKAGDKFVIDGKGALVLDQCPSKLCVGAIAAFKTLTDRMTQAFYDGKSEVLLDTVHCPDVGLREGGWGMITMRVSSTVSEKN
jgi:uncharacterized repeat protein (TIGR04076 family)